MDERPTARQLQMEKNARRRAKRAVFDGVMARLYSRIAFKARSEWTRLVFEVPPLVLGTPSFNVGECTIHLCRALRRDGYLVEVFGSNVLYVSWDRSELLAAAEQAGMH